MLRAVLILLGAGLSTTAWAQETYVSAGPEKVAVVVYRDGAINTAGLLDRNPVSHHHRYGAGDGLGMIVETRTIDLPAGETTIRFRGVSTGIVPETATLEGLPAQIVEHNTDFELLSPASLLEHSIGEIVQVARTNPETGRETVAIGVVRAATGGPVLEVHGGIEALNCSGLTQRIIFDRVPDGLGDEPVLSTRVRMARAGRYTVTLAYLVTDLMWSADYVARLNPDGRTVDLTGWITLVNFGGTSFRNAPVQVIAGRLNRDDETQSVEPVIAAEGQSCWPFDTTTRVPRIQIETSYGLANKRMPDSEDEYLDSVVVTGSRVIDPGELGDYKLYALPEPTDVNARQSKQVQFLDRSDVRFTRGYLQSIDAYGDQRPAPASVFMRFRNTAADGLGLPMPGGGVSLFEMRDGRPLLAGEYDFTDRGVGVPLELYLGESADVFVSSEVDSERRWTNSRGDWRQATITVTITNEQVEPVVVDIHPREHYQPDFRVLSAPQPLEVLSSGASVWRVRVPAQGESRLTYTIQYRD